MPRSRISGMPRSNAKVKNFRNAKVKCQGQEFQECVEWETENGKPEKTGKWETGKMGNGKMGKCNKNKKTINT